MTTSVANLDVTQYVKVNAKQKSITLQSLRDEVRIALSDVKPVKDNKVFHTLSGADDPLQFLNIETDVWVLAVTDRSHLVITETDEVGKLKDYLIEVGKGNEPGHSLRGIVMRNPDVSSTFVDIWGGPGSMIYPTANETWEVRSDDINDTLSGTGSHSLTQNYLDENYIEKTVTVDLDGITWVTLSSDMFRSNGALALPSGSNMRNHGKITIRDVATQNVRQVISPGFSASQDSHFTVPANKTILTMQSISFYPKNESGVITSNIMFFGTNTWITGISIPAYQSGFTIDIKALLPFPEKTEILIQANSTNPNVDVSAILEMLIVDNEFIT